jgi:hypothetical protein
VLSSIKEEFFMYSISTAIKKLLMVAPGIALATLGISGSAEAATAYLSNSNQQIGTVDTATGVFTPVVSNTPTFTDIALSSKNQLFGNTFSQLYSVNTTTKTTSLIGNLGIDDLNALGFNNNDVLYGASTNGKFYTINTSTGAASVVANIPGFTSGGDIVYNPSTNTFLATSSTALASGTGDDLFSITPTGTATNIGKIGYSDVYGLVFNDGTLFGYTANNEQLIINSTTGAGTLDRLVTGDSGQTFGAANTPVPEPITMLGSGTALIIGGLLKRKFRSKEHRNPV